jgi:Arc/MetJ family transcription regulator
MMCKKWRLFMPTNLAINDQLLQEALEISGLKTKKDTVNLALQEFVNKRKQMEILNLFGTMDPDPEYDYKKGRYR